MAAFARWTNLSETTFLLEPTDERADYRLRIFTPGLELPFAGHPTLGSAHAWLEAGGEPQERGRARPGVRARGWSGCGGASGWRSRRRRWCREGPVGDEDRARIVGSLRIDDDEVVDMAWADNGPGWVAVLLESAERGARAASRTSSRWATSTSAWSGRTTTTSDADIEVRAFCPEMGIGEDPVTGSLNASIGQWLAGDRLPTSYVAAQGTAIGRRGRVHIDVEGDTLWVGGDALTTVTGRVEPLRNRLDQRVVSPACGSTSTSSS